MTTKSIFDNTQERQEMIDDILKYSNEKEGGVEHSILRGSSMQDLIGYWNEEVREPQLHARNAADEYVMDKLEKCMTELMEIDELFVVDYGIHEHCQDYAVRRVKSKLENMLKEFKLSFDWDGNF